VCPTPHLLFAPQLPSSFLNFILLPICIELRYIAGPLPPTLLLAISQGTWNHDHQLQHHSTSAAGSSEFAPKTTTTRSRGEPAFSFCLQDHLCFPMTCVETQTVGLHQLDKMAGLQKHPRIKAAARYTLFYHACFLKFCNISSIFCCPKSMFSFSTRNQHLRILWIPVHFPRPAQLFRLPRGFHSRVVIHALPKALSCDLPTRDRISSRPRRNMACGK
jgi:hypothetical protein